MSLAQLQDNQSFPVKNPSALVVKNPPAKAGDIRDMGLIPGLGRSPAGEDGNLLQYSCPENPRQRIDRGAWWATVHRVAKSRTRLRRLQLAGTESDLERASSSDKITDQQG